MCRFLAAERLLQLIVDRRGRDLFDQLSAYLARQIYQGYGYDLGSQMAKAAVRRVTELVTGTVTVTLYKGQWERLLGEKEAIEAFLVANASKLSVKGD